MSTHSDRRAAATPEAGRRPWEPPAIAWEEDFEPYVFSTCGKMPGQGGICSAHQNS